MKPNSSLAWAAIDFLSALILVVYVLIAPPPKPRSAVDTLGTYAIILTWPGGCQADEDLWVRAPGGITVYFNNREAAGMHLELDDIPLNSGYARGTGNFERTVIRKPLVGEYTVNVHSYAQNGCRTPTSVSVALWRLAGDDRLERRQRLLMRGEGDEQTAFRFSLRRDESVGGFNRLPRSLVG